MDIEELSKTQIVFLTLFVSFVTSIATGIVTASLMQEAPPAITQTVNRVVERTVEKVVPGQPATVAAPITKTETVIVKESDTIPQAVAALAPSIVKAYTAGAEPSFIGLGIVLSSAGTIALDESALGERPEVVIEVGSGVRVRAGVVRRAPEYGIAYASAATSTIDGKPVPAWKPASFATANPVLGATVVALSGKSALRVGQGILTATAALGDTEAQVLETDIASTMLLPGAILMDTDGGVIGFSTGISRTQDPAAFVSGNALGAK